MMMSRTMHNSVESFGFILRYMGGSDPEASFLRANVTRLRKERGLSQHKLAALAGISRSTIAAIELGRYRSADTATVEALAKALGVEPGTLLRPDPERAPIAPFVNDFIASPWAQAVKPTDEELDWLRGLPEVVWFGSRPTAESFARILLWRRETEKGPGQP
jgi:transcriptional regulator with XRE-family HTH domain